MMDATTGFDPGADQSSQQSDPGALYTEFMARAAALTQGAIAGANALVADIAMSDLTPAAFKPLATTIAKGTGLDRTALVKQLNKGRSAHDGATDDDDPEQPQISTLPNPPPSLTPEPLAVALDQIVRVIQLRVVCANEVAWAVALWIVATWGVRGPGEADGPDLFPRLVIRSATKRCGKSLLLEVVLYLVATPISAENVTTAAVFRVTAMVRPTWCIDEADTFLRKNEELRGAMNSGFARRGSVIRMIEVNSKDSNGRSIRTFEPRSFSTYAPMVIAGIGRMADTIEDRAIRAVLKRQPAPRARSRRLRNADLLKARELICACLHAHGDAMAAAMAARPVDDDYPDELNDRDADNWQPLVAVAKLAGGAWPARTQRAIRALCEGAEAEAQKSDAERLLVDVFDFVRAHRQVAVEEYIEWRQGGRPTRRSAAREGGYLRPSPIQQLAETTEVPRRYTFIVSDELALAMMNIDDSAVADARDVNAAKLKIATMLRSFGIRPRQRRAGKPVRGYDVAALRPVWRGYRIAKP